MFSLRRQLTVDLVNEAVDPVRHAMFARQYVRSGTLLRLVGNESAFLGGIPGGENGDVITVLNDSGDYLKGLENESPKFRPEERLALPDSFPAFMMPNDTLSLMYDGTAQRWRVLSWPTRGMQGGFELFTDEAHESASLMATATSGTGATSYGSSGGRLASAVFGSAVVRTGTTTTGYAEQGGNGYAPYQPTMGAALVGCRLRLENTSDGTDTWQAWIGLGTSGVAAASKTDAVVWEYRWNGAAHEWGTLVMNNTVAARSTTNAPAPATGLGDYIALVVFMAPSGTRADFLVSTHATGHQFTLAQSVSSGLPASSRLLGVLAPGVAKIAGTNTRGVIVDWSGTRIAATRAA